MTSPDRALLATAAAPGVADPVQPVAAELGRGLAEPYRPNRDVVRVNYGPDPFETWRDGVRKAAERRMRKQYPCTPVTRLCIACGTVRECDPALPCGECGATSFHLIPLRSPAA